MSLRTGNSKKRRIDSEAQHHVGPGPAPSHAQQVQAWLNICMAQPRRQEMLFAAFSELFVCTRTASLVFSHLVWADRRASSFTCTAVHRRSAELWDLSDHQKQLAQTAWHRKQRTTLL